RLHSTRGGLSETELNELHVRPHALPLLSSAVIMATPVGKQPNAWRNSLLSNPAVAPVDADSWRGIYDVRFWAFTPGSPQSHYRRIKSIRRIAGEQFLIINTFISRVKESSAFYFPSEARARVPPKSSRSWSQKFCAGID